MDILIKFILYILILLLAIPSGILISYLCSDEIRAWRKRMIIFSIISFLISIIIFLQKFEYSIPISLALLFFAITFFSIYLKSFRNKINKISKIKSKKHRRKNRNI